MEKEWKFRFLLSNPVAAPIAAAWSFNGSGPIGVGFAQLSESPVGYAAFASRSQIVLSQARWPRFEQRLDDSVVRVAEWRFLVATNKHRAVRRGQHHRGTRRVVLRRRRRRLHCFDRA